MPYKTISSAKTAGFPTKIDKVDLTLAQLNKLADIYDAVKEKGDTDNPMAVAIAQFKKLYTIEGDKWVKASEGIFSGNLIALDSLKFEETKDGGAMSEIKIMNVGKWDHPQYGNFEIKPEDFDKFIYNFNNGVRAGGTDIGLPIDEEHRSADGARGWIKKLINRGTEGLYALVEWNKKGRQLIKDNIYRFFSPEFYFSYEDPETHQRYKYVLIGGGLTNRPYFKGLGAISLSEAFLIKENEHMKFNIEEISKKTSDELTDDEKAFVTENFDELGDEAKEKFADLKPEEKKDEKEDEKKDEKADEKKDEKTEDKTEDKKEEVEEKVEASEQVIQLSEQVKTLSEKLRSKEIDEQVSKLVFSESNKSGKFLPKTKSKLSKFVLSLSEEQSKAFNELISDMPALGELFSEKGSSVVAAEAGQAPVGVDQESYELDQTAQTIMASEKNAKGESYTYEEALGVAAKRLNK